MYVILYFQQKDSFFRSLVEASKNSAEIFTALNAARPDNESNPDEIATTELIDDDEKSERTAKDKSVTAF